LLAVIRPDDAKVWLGQPFVATIFVLDRNNCSPRKMIQVDPAACGSQNEKSIDVTSSAEKTCPFNAAS
jgi:hypothetical protein